MDRCEIGEILKAAECYLQKLKDLDEQIKTARNQIVETSEQAEFHACCHFTFLEDSLVQTLSERKDNLLKEISTARDKGITPLSKCSLVVNEKIKETETLINLGKLLHEQESIDIQEGLEQLNQQSALLGSLPEVPALKEVPYIAFEDDDSCDFEDILGNYGRVTKIAPIQICQLTEKPGAILVEWQIVDAEEKSVDIQEFCLQKALNVSDKPVFQTCYRGADSQFLVKDVEVSAVYSFRVNFKFEGSNQFSRWSYPQKFRTTLKPFSWKTSIHISLYNDCKIATPLVDSAPVIISDGPQFKVGYTIEFTILSTGDSVAYLGVVTDETIKQLSSMDHQDGSFVLDSEGKIKVDGLSKSTLLPKFENGSKISFSCDCIKDDKVVIHIDLNEKRVTYEWGIDRKRSFHFAAELPSPAWKIMVE